MGSAKDEAVETVEDIQAEAAETVDDIADDIAKTTEEMKFIKRNYFNYDGKNYSYDKSYIVHVRASNEDWYGQKSESCHERFIRASELTTEAK